MIPKKFRYYDAMWETLRTVLAQRHAEGLRRGLRVVEVGSRYGHWARQALDALSVETIYCVDRFPRFPRIVKKWCEVLGEDAMTRAVPLRGKSAEWGRVWRLPIDLLYIDAKHSYEAVKEDIGLWWPHVRAGGVMMCHDLQIKGVARAYVESEASFHVEDWGPYKRGHTILTGVAVKR
jgi:predicted O-methyltransferase YrrM